tara:strand:+ start:156 stop:695 length:540 start_codon:yes stop_codon:yes gene_type:complete
MEIALNNLATKYKRVASNRVVKVQYKRISKNQKLRGIVATSDIPKGVLVATYPVVSMFWKKVTDTQNDYVLTIHDAVKYEAIKSELVGAPTIKTLSLNTEDSIGLPPIGMFVNEPTKGSINCEIIFPTVFVNEVRNLEGRILYGFIKTIKNIKKGQELLACYSAPGETHYERDYKSSCA